MDSILIILAVVWIHFIMDFVLQPRWIADNKGKKLSVLTLHCIMYSLPFAFIDPIYAAVNCVLHLGVDSVSSRITSHFWDTGNDFGLFATIGVDQAVHLTILLLTLGMLL